jgi:periplasmic copper chaperone A
MKRRYFLALALLPATVWAHSFTLGPLAIGHAWVKPTTGSETEAMMPIANGGTSGDVLISAKSVIADHIEFRGDKKKFENFDVPVGRPLPMRPRGLHLQLIGLKAPVVLGTKIPMTLVFAKAGSIDIEMLVENSPGE